MAADEGKGIAVHVWSMDPAPEVKIFTLDEIVYASVSGVDYMEVKSAKAPPSLLYILVDIFELECGGGISRSDIKHVNVSVNLVEPMTRSGSLIKISFDVIWCDNEQEYGNNDLYAVFALPL